MVATFANRWRQKSHVVREEGTSPLLSLSRQNLQTALQKWIKCPYKECFQPINWIKLNFFFPFSQNMICVSLITAVAASDNWNWNYFIKTIALIILQLHIKHYRFFYPSIDPLFSNCSVSMFGSQFMEQPVEWLHNFDYEFIHSFERGTWGRHRFHLLTTPRRVTMHVFFNNTSASHNF